MRKLLQEHDRAVLSGGVTAERFKTTNAHYYLDTHTFYDGILEREVYEALNGAPN